MHGYSSTSVLLVNAEIYSMGGAVEAGVGTANRTSPRQVAIQKVQDELRQEYDVREERKRELEFLEKGGNPLDFKLGDPLSVSVQSTSYPDQHPASEAKGSLALTASTHGDSVESSGDRNPLHPRNNIVPSEISSQMDVSDKAVELKDSAAFGIPRKAYKRRNRSRPSREVARPNPADVTGLVTEDLQQDMKLDGVKAVQLTRELNDCPSVDATSKNSFDELPNQQNLSGDPNTPIQLDSNGPEAVQKIEEMGSAVSQIQQGLTVAKPDKQAMPFQMNGSVSKNGEGNDSEMCTKNDKAESDGNTTNETLIPEKSGVIEGGEIIEDKKEMEGTSNGSSPKIGVKDHNTIEEMKDCGPTVAELDKVHADLLAQNSAPKNDDCCNVVNQDVREATISDIKEAESLTREATISDIKEAESSTRAPKNNAFVEAQASKSEFDTTNVVDEDSILKEARDIEAKRKRIIELSMMTAPVELRQKSQWDYVLEEMAWLANDFAQERIWKISAAAQVSHQVAFTCRKRKQERVSAMAMKKVAHTLAEAVMEFWHSVEEKGKEFEHQSQKDTVSVHTYAMRFLKYNDSNVARDQSQMPLTPDSISDLGTNDLSWEDCLTEENLFYSILPGAMEAYRNSVESHVEMCERNGGSAQEEVDTSPFDNVAGYDSQYNAFDDDEGETSTYDKPSRFGQKKQKHPLSSFLVKRPGSSLNVSIPTKRVRTASRRVISPYGAGTSGQVQFPSKTVSSGDTDSFQDDQSTPGGGSLRFDAESVGDFENQIPFDSAEVSTKPKKKKKGKNLSIAHEQRWQNNSGFQHEQKDHFKRRTENHQVESNYSTGQPATKKPKIMRQSHDNFFNNVTPTSGSVPSPVASQMSNMTKLLNGTRDRGRKPKGHKAPAGQLGSGSGWSKFEEQALVVLVHDLGPNWELVSDAFNSTFHFKCIFRKAQECKERHKTLVDISSGDGADSADDSGSSQHYPSTLPGIPKGSARQLFQRLQGPIEEETLKSHFEKIIMISQKRHCRKALDRVPFQQPHSSHTVALSQVCPNNLNGGPILTPADFCAAIIAGQDIPALGYQGPSSSGVAVPSQTPLSPVLPVSAANSALQGSQNMMIGNNVSSSPGPLGSSARDGRYVVPRSASLSTDEQQQRMQQYNYRNVSQPNNISSPGAHPGIDRARILPSNNGMGMAVNRSMSMPRPGFASSSIVNPGSMVAPAMPRPRDASHMMRPALNQDSQRKIAGPDVQMPGNNQNTPHFGGLSSATNSSPVTSYTVHHQPPSHPLSPQHSQLLSPRHPHFQGPPNHVPGPHQQAFANRLAKERQLQQQRLIPQKQSNSLMPPQILTSSPPMQNTTQSHASTPSSSMNTVAQLKHPVPNQNSNQRPKQQLSQSNRQHPLQRQLSQGKVAKGVAAKNQNVPVDPAQLNGVSINPTANQCMDKGEPANSVPQAMQPKRRYMPSQSPNPILPQQNKLQHDTSRPDNSIPLHNSQSVASPGAFAGHQSIPPVVLAGTNNQKLSTQNQSPQQINTDQHPTNNSAEMDKESTLHEATKAVAIVSPAATNQPQSSDPLSFVPTPSSVSGSMPQVGQGPNLHSNQKARLLQAGSGNLNGRMSDHDPGLE